jgi:uncharacterized protein (UPF0333 family)
MNFLKKKGQAGSVMGVLALIIAAVLAIIIVNAFIDAGNFTDTTLTTLLDTVPYILVSIGIFAGLGAMGLFR